MGQVSVLDMRKWGTGITDFRHFNSNIMPDERAKELQAAGVYVTEDRITPEQAQQIITASVGAAPPGVIFVGNPWRGNYAQWLIAFRKFGFQQMGTKCSINWVMAGGNKSYGWKGGMYTGVPKQPIVPNWDSPDGYRSWEHVLYYVKQPVPKLEFDFKDRITQPLEPHRYSWITGDNEQTPWQINYGGRIKRAPKPRWEANYARLSKNCGIAMGFGLPECGDELTKEFLTVMAIPESKLMPKGWTKFLTVGGLKFGHNLGLLEDSTQDCNHVFEF